jgi:outer membrane protein
MRLKKYLFIIFVFASLNAQFVSADMPHYLDFKLILNQSDAGSKAQKFLKNKIEKGLSNVQKKEKQIQEEEKKIIQQKKLISPEDYKKKVTSLRAKVSSLQKERSTLLDSVSKQRLKARNEILKALNPIISDYMKEKKIRMVVDKKSLLLADENLNITKDILDRLNQKLKIIKLN